MLMDLQMPVMGGYEAVAIMRAEEQAGKRVPILALTAGTIKGERERSLQAGMDDYLSKPIDTERLRAALAKWVQPEQKAIDSSLTNAAVSIKGTDTNRHFDRERLLQKLGGNEEHLQMVIAAILSGILQEQADELSEAVRQRAEAKAIRSLAHKLKGSGLSACFDRLANLAYSIEQVQPFDYTQIDNVVANISEEIQLLLKTIQNQHSS